MGPDQGAGRAWHNPPTGSRRAPGLSLSNDDSANTAEKVAEVQDLMRQRLHMLQEEQQRQWQSVQTALQQQLASVQQTADEAVHCRLDDLRNHLSVEAQRSKAEMDMMKKEIAASADKAQAEIAQALRQCASFQEHSGSLADDLASLRQHVQQLDARVNKHDVQLAAHSTDIEQLQHAHQECCRFRMEAAREQQLVSTALGQLRDEVRQAQDAVRQARAAADDCAKEHRVAMDSLSAEVKQVASEQRAAGDAFDRQLRKLHGEAAAAAKLAREAAERPLPPAPPSPKAAQPSFPVEVSREAYALLRNADGDLHELPELHNVIGRNSASTVCICTSQAVSNRHASVDIDHDGRFSLKDLGSRNGTFLNDRRVPEDSGFVLNSGDSIRLGADGPFYMFEFGPAYFCKWPHEPQRVRDVRGK